VEKRNAYVLSLPRSKMDRYRKLFQPL